VGSVLGFRKAPQKISSIIDEISDRCMGCWLLVWLDGKDLGQNQITRGTLMRVDFVITELFVGGAERCLTELALGLAECGDQVRVFSLGSLPEGEQRILVRRLRSAGVPVESGHADSVIGTFGAYRRLRRWFEQSRPEISQTFLHHANVVGTFAAKASGVQLRVGGIRVAESRPFRCRVERAAVKRMHSVVCVSKAVEDFAAVRIGCSPEKSIVIPNGVNVSRFASATPYRWSKLGWPRDADVTLFVGRLHSQKGIELIQDQIDSIAPAGSNRRLLLVGQGPLRSRLQQWVNQIGTGRVQLMSWQSDVAPLMRACRLLLLPSRYEGMPNVVLEAMAASRPVVCSRVEGCEELLAHALEDQSFPSGDGAAMKNLVQRFLSDPSLCDQIGNDNQSRVRADFSIPAMVDAYRSHYRTLLGRRLDRS
jgi:starch synthase (maltosyl-transferring)